MMYKANLIIDDDVESLYQLFHSEDKDLGRSSYTIAKKGGKLEIKIAAKDANAFKTAANTIAKVLQVWEKSEKIE